MRNKLHLSSFLLKIEQMLYDWSMASSSNTFVSKPSISSHLEWCAFKWSNNIDKQPIIHWFHSWYIVPSSITAAVCLHMSQLQQWTSFANFVIWLRCCWLVCPSALKYDICKHWIGLPMILNQYIIKDAACVQHY